MSDLEEKALRQPFRFGLMLGALALPTLWTVSQNILSLVLGKPLLSSEEVTNLFALGFLPGMILGAGALRAWVAWRAREIGSARWLLIGHSVFVALPCLLFSFLGLNDVFAQTQNMGWNSVLRQVALVFYINFPLQVALVMLLLGLFMRAPRR